MYAFTHHVKLKFTGHLNYSFNFDIRYTEDEMYNCTLPNADIKRIFKIDEDGYLYINGYRITKNKDSINAIYRSIFVRAEEGFVDVTLAIDSNGRVVVVKRKHSNNQMERILGKLLG